MATEFKKIALIDDLHRGVGCSIDAGEGNIIVSGNKGGAVIPYDGTITQWAIEADVSGNIEFDLWKTAGAVPTVANTIVGDTAPALSGTQFGTSTDMTNWTTTVTKGDVIMAYVETDSTVRYAFLVLYITRT